MNDGVTYDNIHDMIQQLVSLAEYCFTDRNDGSRKLFNVKTQISEILKNDKSSQALQMNDVLITKMIEDVLTESTRRELIQLAKNILQISTRATGCLATCLK